MVVHQICDASLRGSLICKVARMLIYTLLVLKFTRIRGTLGAPILVLREI